MVLLGCLAAYTAATVLLILAASDHGPAPAVLVTSAALGAASPPTAVLMRTVWHHAAEHDMLTTAMALDSAMMGTALITGPVLASWLSLSFSGVVPLIVIAVMTAVVVFLLLDTPASPRPAVRRHWLGPLTSAPLRRLLIADGLFVLAVTATDVLLPIYAKEYDAAVYTGAYLAALSIGSVLGSLVLGAAPRLLAHGPKLSVLLCVFAAGGGTLALAAQFSPWRSSCSARWPDWSSAPCSARCGRWEATSRRKARSPRRCPGSPASTWRAVPWAPRSSRTSPSPRAAGRRSCWCRWWSC